MGEYKIIIEKAENCYNAYSPDVPGCIATGKTKDETIKNLKSAIKFHQESFKKNNE